MAEDEEQTAGEEALRAHCVRGQARTRPRRRQPALDRLGDRERLSDDGAQLGFTYQGERIEASVRELAESIVEPARDRLRRPLGRGRRARLLGGGRTSSAASSTCSCTRSPSRPPRISRAASPTRRGPVLDGARRERVLARRVRARRRAADGRRRGRVDRDDDVPRRRARRAALQRDGRRQGDPRLEREVPRLGSRPQATSG